MKDKTIVILGAGIGGIVAARELRRHLGNKHHIVLVDRSNTHSFPPSYLWVMMGWRKTAAIQRPLALLEKYGIDFHHSPVRAINVQKRIIRTDLQQFSYDYLIIALGAELAPQKIPGLAEAMQTNYTLEGSGELHALLQRFSQGSVAVVVASLPYKCPPAPYETALLLKSFFNRRGTPEIAIKVFTPEPIPIGAAGAPAGHALKNLLQQRSIELYCEHNLKSVEPTKKELRFENRSTFSYDLLIAVPPHEAPSVAQEAGLTNQNGWIAVDEESMITAYPNVYAIGDITSIPTPGGIALPKAGIFAHNQAEVVAHNIAAEILRSGQQKKFTGVGYCFIEAGDGKAAYVYGNFLATPSPQVTVHEPSVTYHWGKVVFEKYWLWRWF